MKAMPITRDLIINGKHVPAASGKTTEDVNPYTGTACHRGGRRSGGCYARGGRGVVGL
jgi:hypothetical protein